MIAAALRYALELGRQELARRRPATPVTRSPLAIQVAKGWDGTDRPQAWQGKEYGLVVHTTGGGLPAKALDRGVAPTVLGTTIYRASHGCHYLCGWRGINGDLLQLADEREQASGVGVRADQPDANQWTSVQRGRGAWERDLPPTLVARWRARWPGWSNPLDLLPGTKSANAPYVHLELIPCVFHRSGKLVEASTPLRPGLRFTSAQHDAVAALACDLAARKGWGELEAVAWWRTPRLVGHEDLTPLSRHDRAGGWDPGGLRAEPYFDWRYVYSEIARRTPSIVDSYVGDEQAPRDLARTRDGLYARF